jgi:hypothetical protein
VPNKSTVILAKAYIQAASLDSTKDWTPAFAGVTIAVSDTYLCGALLSNGVTPEQAGLQKALKRLDARFRGNDEKGLLPVASQVWELIRRIAAVHPCQARTQNALAAHPSSVCSAAVVPSF